MRHSLKNEKYEELLKFDRETNVSSMEWPCFDIRICPSLIQRIKADSISSMKQAQAANLSKVQIILLCFAERFDLCGDQVGSRMDLHMSSRSRPEFIALLCLSAVNKREPAPSKSTTFRSTGTQ